MQALRSPTALPLSSTRGEHILAIWTPDMEQEPTSTQDMPLEPSAYSMLHQYFMRSDPGEAESISTSDEGNSTEAPTTPVDLSYKAPSPPRFLQHQNVDSYLPAAMQPPLITSAPTSMFPFMLPGSPSSDPSSSPTSQPESFADVHVCPYCSRRFKYKNNLSTHIKNKHKQDNQPSQCEICGKHFSSRASMTFHLNKFHLPQTLACKLCPLRFSQPVYLNAHMKTKHSQSSCNFCCEPVNPSDNTKSHLVDSTCPMCNNVFWCATFKEKHLRSTTCGAKLALFQNMLNPYPAPVAPLAMLPPAYPMAMQEPCRGCPDCVRPPLPPISEPMLPLSTPTCSICGATFSDMGSLGFHVGVIHVGMGQNYSAGIC